MRPPHRPPNLYFIPEKESGILPLETQETQETQNTQETTMQGLPNLTTLYPSSSYVKNFPRYCVTVHDTSPDSFSLRDGDATISPYLFLMTG